MKRKSISVNLKIWSYFLNNDCDCGTRPNDLILWIHQIWWTLWIGNLVRWRFEAKLDDASYSTLEFDCTISIHRLQNLNRLKKRCTLNISRCLSFSSWFEKTCPNYILPPHIFSSQLVFLITHPPVTLRSQILSIGKTLLNLFWMY